MSRVRALDSSHDWTFGAGRNNYKSGLDAVAQNLDTRLNSFLGDCFFDRQGGIDWFNFLGSKNQVGLQLAISATIINTNEVLKIITLFFNLQEDIRFLTATFKVQASTGFIGGTFNAATITKLLTTESGLVLTTEGGSPLTTG